MSRPWSNESDSALSIELRPSRALRVYLLVLMILATFAILSYPLSPVLRLLLIVLVALILWRQCGSQLGLGGYARIEKLHWTSDGRWMLEQGGERQLATLTYAYAHTGVVLLRFRLPGSRRRDLVLPWDSLDAEAARCLRVRLRTRGLRR